MDRLAGPAADPRARRDVALALLEAGLCPRRYLRNVEVVGLEGQARLLKARVGIAGVGGLGGTVVELLARAGVGELVLVDPDAASEDNLNRQVLVTTTALGRAKVELAATRVAEVNPAVTVRPHRVRGDRQTFAELFRGVDVAVDALDNVGDRLVLQEAVRALGVPLVHGAIAGLTGQVTTVFPQDPGLEVLYGTGGGLRDPAAGGDADDTGVGTRPGETRPPGSLSATAALVAAAQAQEVLKLLTGTGRPLRGRLLVLDSLSPYAAIVDL
ncbi:MAG: HesA/MoeB/ThiF family protein [Firmicutes bacterium]|nr:HesA/MoeB/ThiF family protein [Bacillota bacterium]